MYSNYEQLSILQRLPSIVSARASKRCTPGWRQFSQVVMLGYKAFMNVCCAATVAGNEGFRRYKHIEMSFGTRWNPRKPARISDERNAARRRDGRLHRDAAVGSQHESDNHAR